MIKQVILTMSLKKRKKILIIDDEEDLCLLIKAHLSRKNYEVYTSYSLKQGLKEVETVLPDILFLDNNLPDGLGWESAKKILGSHPNIQVHLISAFNTPSHKEDVAVAKVWEKPISLRELDNYFQ